jgi:hypothetical protein
VDQRQAEDQQRSGDAEILDPAAHLGRVAPHRRLEGVAQLRDRQHEHGQQCDPTQGDGDSGERGPGRLHVD